MTEEEARKKWCPMFRVATSGGDSSTFETDNRPAEHEKRDDGKWCPTGLLHPSCRCIASRCMAWRWRYGKSLDDVRYAAQMGIDALKKEDGYCGLARKPT